MIGLKGRRRPTRHKKADTQIGKLRTQLAALERLTATLSSLDTAAKNWTSFMDRFADNLPDAVKSPDILTAPTDENDRQHKHALCMAQLLSLRGQYNLRLAHLQRRNAPSDNNTNIFREAYQSYMQTHEKGPIDHLIQGGIIDDPKSLHSTLLHNLQEKYKTHEEMKLNHLPQTDTELQECIDGTVWPRIAQKIATSNLSAARKKMFETILQRKKKHIPSTAYKHLETDITPAELDEELANADTQTSAGTDAINKWWWKQLIISSPTIRDTVLREFNSYLHHHAVPDTDAIINLIQKKAGPGNVMSNLRPLTIQHAIRKIFTGILARRLAKIHSKHKLINENQHAFLPEQSYGTVSATLLNTLEYADQHDKPIYAIFYDLTQAYDRVQWAMLAWAMQRLKVPNSFIRLALSLLRSTHIRTQTAHGLSDEAIQFEKGVPQGDPIAPILFDIVIDALHELLTELTQGFHIDTTADDGSPKTEALHSQAFADDISTYSGTIADLTQQHDIVSLFTDILDIPINMDKTQLLASEGKGRPLPPDHLKPDDIFARNKNHTLNNLTVAGKWSNEQRQTPSQRRTPADAVIHVNSKQGTLHVLRQDEHITFLGTAIRPDLSPTQAQNQLIADFRRYCGIALSIPKDRPWSLHELRLYLNEHVYSRMEHHCTVYPIEDDVLNILDSDLANLVSRLASTTRMTAGEYSETTISHFMGIPKPSHRAKVIFAHHTLVMLGRSDLSGRIARQMLDRAEHLQHRVNPLNNRAFELRRIIHSLGLTLERNSPFQAEPARPVQADIYDRSTEQTRSVNTYCQNTRLPAAPTGTPTTQQPTQITDESTSTKPAEPADTPITQQPIQITVATDGSFNKHTNMARYGFILLTPQLLRDHKHLASITQDDVLCRKLLAYPPQTIVFRLASMEPGSAQNSFQPEALGAALAQVSLPPECRKEFIMDNTSAMRDITTPSPKPNRSAGRLPQKLHQTAANTFSTTWKARYTDPATTRHQKSHTTSTTLEAFLNRCIDVLLTHAPAHLDTAQPDLRSMEHPRGWIIRHKGQHIFGDRRRAILHSFLDKTKTVYPIGNTGHHPRDRPRTIRRSAQAGVGARLPGAVHHDPGPRPLDRHAKHILHLSQQADTKLRPMRRPRWRHRRPLPAMPTHRARPRTSQHTNLRRVPTRSREITTVRRPDPGRPARRDHTAARSQQQRPGHQHHPTGNQIAIRPAQSNMHGMQEGSHLESIRWQTVFPQVRAATTSPAHEQLTRRRQQPAQPSTAQTVHRLRQDLRDA